MRAMLLTAAALITAGLAAPEAPAQAKDPFTVAGIPVDARAETAAAAQSAALSEGQLEAARRLIDRLTLQEDRDGPPPAPAWASELGVDSGVAGEVYGVDPSLLVMDPPAAGDEDAAAWDGTGLPPLDAETAAGLVAGLEIADEQRSATRYIAQLTVGFDRRAVARWLERYDVPFVQAQARPVLVVPVLERAGAPLVWEGPWYETWLEGGFAHALAPMIALGSRDAPERVDFLTLEQAERAAGITPDLAGLADALRDSGELLIEDPLADFEPVEREPEPLGRDILPAQAAYRLDEAVLAELAALYGVEQVAVIRARPGGGAVRADGVLFDFAGETPSAVELPSAAAPDYARVAAAIVERRETDWKRRVIVRGDAAGELVVTVLFDDLQGWRALRSAIAGASLVTNARLDALSREGAAMTLAYRGAREQLADELAQRGVRLAEEERLGWTARAAR